MTCDNLTYVSVFIEATNTSTCIIVFHKPKSFCDKVERKFIIYSSKLLKFGKTLIYHVGQLSFAKNK